MASEGDVRELALSLPETTEKPSYGTPGFRVRDRLFARIREEADVLVLWRENEEEKKALLEAEPEKFFTTPPRGGYAASKVQSADLAPGAVHTSNVFKRAVTSGKLAVGAVRSNQIADAAVGSKQIADAAIGARQIEVGGVGSKQIGTGAAAAKQIADGTVGEKQIGTAVVAPSNLQFPVFYAASPTGGSAPVTEGLDPYPIADHTWTQNPGQIEVIFGAATAALAYDGSGSGSCQLFFEVSLNGQQVGGGGLSTSSTEPQLVEQNIGAQPQIDPIAPVTNHLSVRAGSNGDCSEDSTIDSVRFRVLDFG